MGLNSYFVIIDNYVADHRDMTIADHQDTAGGGASDTGDRRWSETNESAPHPWYFPSPSANPLPSPSTKARAALSVRPRRTRPRMDVHPDASLLHWSPISSRRIWRRRTQPWSTRSTRRRCGSGRSPRLLLRDYLMLLHVCYIFQYLQKLPKLTPVIGGLHR